MAETHWSHERLGQFVRGELGRAESKKIVRHFARGCAACELSIRPWFEVALAEQTESTAEAPEAAADGYDAAIEKAFGRAIRSEERRAARRRRLTAETDWFGVGDLKGIPLVEDLLRRSFEERFRDPWQMWRLAFVARLTADQLDASYFGSEIVADVRAKAWMELGNAHRVRDEIDEANEALVRAEQLLVQGTGSKLLAARLADVRSSWCFSVRQVSEAIALLELVHSAYLELGDRHLAGRALSQMGLYLQLVDRSLEAKEVLGQALSMIDASREPEILHLTKQNLLRAYVDCGEYKAAAEYFLRSGLARDFADEPLNLARLRWLEGSILVGLGRPTKAERCLVSARAELLDHGLDYTAGYVGLDLAAVLLDLGRTDEAVALARQVLERFHEVGVEAEAERALRFLAKACEQGRIASRTVRQIGRFLQRLEQEPQLRFQRP